MKKNSLLQQSPYLANTKIYEQALRINVLSSIAIEGVKKSAEKALSPTSLKAIKR
ncbi:MAG: hypothetical protein ACXW11_02395 [Methylotenera sp.]